MSKRERGGRPHGPGRRKQTELFDQEKVEQEKVEPALDAGDEAPEESPQSDASALASQDAEREPVKAEPPEQPEPATPAQEKPREREPWQRFLFGGPHTALGAFMAGLLALGLGFAVMTQVRQNERSGLDKLSQPDLVALLANVNDQSDRLGNELDDLKATKQKLDEGGDTAAVADAQKRLDQLAILNGTSKVKGSGIRIAVTHADGKVTAANVLDAVQELRDAGAESIDVGGTRVIASTWFDDRNGNPTVEGKPLPDSFTILAIGDSHTLSTAMAIPGGVTDTLTQAGAQVKVTEDSAIEINSVRPTK